MSESIKVLKKDVWWIVSRAFPDYPGRKFRVHPSNTITFYDTNWGGGTRNAYAAVPLSREDGRSVIHHAAPPWDNPVEGRTVEIPRGVAVIEHSIFMGKDLGITVWVRPGDLAPLLPAGGQGLSGMTEAEKDHHRRIGYADILVRNKVGWSASQMLEFVLKGPNRSLCTSVPYGMALSIIQNALDEFMNATDYD